MSALLQHRHGGTITAVHAIGHDTHKGVADWFFVGDVQWLDGSSSKRLRIAPFALGHNSTPAGEAECNRLHGLLTDYLRDVGTWHDAKRKRDGRVYSWTPKEPTGERGLP